MRGEGKERKKTQTQLYGNIVGGGLNVHQVDALIWSTNVTK